MPVVPENIWNVLHTVSRYLFPLLALSLVFLVLFFILSESANRRERVRSLPGSGTVGELVVLSGGQNLDINTWFPVPREGVLGSIRSCDLVIPCPGVRNKHLDFSWQDGQGLLIRPRTGCEVLINGTPVNCRTNAATVPLTHGSVLQIGSAVLRLHLFAALDNTVAPVQPTPGEMSGFSGIPSPMPCSLPVPPPQDLSPQAPFQAPYPAQPSDLPEMYSPVFPVEDSFQAPPGPVYPDPGAPLPAPETDTVSPEAQPVRIRRSDRWKEDLGE